jgi:hypothetical protein
MRPEQGLGASGKGYEVHEDEACITHRKQSPNFYGAVHLETATFVQAPNRVLKNDKCNPNPNSIIYETRVRALINHDHELGVIACQNDV